MKRKRQISYMDLLLLCFLAGSMGGCAAANLLSRELLGQIGYFDSIYRLQVSVNRKDRGRLWCCILRQRAMEFGIGCLAGLTPFASMAFCFFAAAGGFGFALQISVFTLQKGWLGLFYFLAAVLPHWIFYMLVWVILAMGVKKGLGKLRLPVWLLLAAAVIAGTLSEAIL